MPDRQRHDEFIWALIFSLIINLLFVFALVMQRYVKKPTGVQPFIVAITAGEKTLPHQSGATTIAVPARTIKPKGLPQAPLSESVDPVLLPMEKNVETTDTPILVSELSAGAETAPASIISTAEDLSVKISEEIAGGTSIQGDKINGDNYTAPEYLVGEKPPYPKRAERNGWEGTVLLNLSINAKGDVEKVEIAQTSGYEILDQQALHSVSAWHFKPARHNGIAIAVTVQQPIIFRPLVPVIAQ